MQKLIEIIAQNRHYQFWTLQFLGWMGWVTLFSLRDAYWGRAFEDIPLLIIDAFAGMVLTTMMRHIYQSVWERPIIVRVITVLGVSGAFAPIWQAIKNNVQRYYYSDLESVEKYDFIHYFDGAIGLSFYLLLCWSGLYFGLKFYRLWQEEKDKSIRAESLAHESQLRVLRYQLNPHFLFQSYERMI